jgi:hypothetical protein
MRLIAKKMNEFFPVSKSLSTWLNKRCWEQELPDLEATLKPAKKYENERDHSEYSNLF